jgi:hypothetical protein
MTSVAVYTGDMGDSLAAKGFSALSIRHVSSSKNPKSNCIKLTSQTRSLTYLTPTF